MRLVPEVGLAYPGRAVKEEGEPADPGPELGPAEGLDAWREVQGCAEDLLQELDC